MLLRELKDLVLPIFVAFGLHFLIIHLASSASEQQHFFWFSDMSEYWAAYRHLGDNPYDPAEMLLTQRGLMPEIETPLMMWNPPWLPMLMPGLWLPFDQAALAWALTNIILWLSSGLVLMRAFRTTSTSTVRNLLPWLIFPLISMPALVNYKMSQMGAVLTFGTALVLYGWRIQHSLTFGLGVVLLSVKPHIFTVFGAFYITRLVCNRELLFGLRSFLPIACLVGLTSALYPLAVSRWLTSVLVTPAGAIDPRLWMTPTLGRWLDTLMSWLGLNLGRATSTLVLFSGVTYAIYLGIRSGPLQFSPFLGLVLLMLSYVASPFSWTFDQMAFVLPQTAVLAMAWSYSESKIRRWRLLLIFLTINLGMLIQWVVYKAPLQYYFWYPLLMTAVCVPELSKQMRDKQLQADLGSNLQATEKTT